MPENAALQKMQGGNAELAVVASADLAYLTPDPEHG
jgi:hypothetical protein